MKVSFRQSLGNSHLSLPLPVRREQFAGYRRDCDVSDIDRGIFIPDRTVHTEKKIQLGGGDMKKFTEKNFRSVQTRHGFYSVGMIAVVIVIAVVVNLIVGQLPEKWKQVDVSNKNIYGVSKTSKKSF